MVESSGRRRLPVAVLVVALVVAPGCVRGGAGSARIVPEVRGTVVWTSGTGAGTAETTMTADGLVQHRPARPTSPPRLGLPPPETRIGRVDPGEVGRLIGIAERDGFFSWDSTYTAPGAESDAFSDVLAVAVENGRRHAVAYQAGARAPELLPELLEQVGALRETAMLHPFTTETARAIVAAKGRFDRVRPSLSATDLARGPCLAEEVAPGWCVDIAHDPRESIDEEAANQCRSYLEGRVDHFVELAPNGDFIRAR